MPTSHINQVRATNKSLLVIEFSDDVAGDVSGDRFVLQVLESKSSDPKFKVIIGVCRSCRAPGDSSGNGGLAISANDDSGSIVWHIS